MCRVGARLCALPLEQVVETMRPLPAVPIAGAPAFVRGVSLIRGDSVPVVDAATLVGEPESQPTRFVTVAVDHRRIALAVDAVLGVRTLPAGTLHDLPPLLHHAETELVTALGELDAELLLVLQCAHLVPEAVWLLLEQERSP
jgi:purine-binding chemotaxis protein CheW